MIRVLWWLLSGFWLQPKQAEPPQCTEYTCRAFRTACISGYCRGHCRAMCRCEEP
ncbi:MAG TPA: hypothetical protein VEA38_14505 [Terriglobales bacterium]|nr:hypothetical protein [Terriglobales bacterium]